MFYHRGVFHSVGIHIEFEIQRKNTKFYVCTTKALRYFFIHLSLTYLLSLQVVELTEEVMPII